MADWTDELKHEVVAEYTDRINEYDTLEDKALYSMQICTEIATAKGLSPNGVRIVLSQNGVYIAKTAANKTSNTSTTSSTTTAKPARGSKKAAIDGLKEAISNIDPSLVDEDLIGKLTGVQATYFTSIITKVV